MKCVLHIGTEKTGTTLLQDWLYDNRTALSAAGIALTDTALKPNNRKLSARFESRHDDFFRSQGITTDTARRHYFDGFEETLGAELAELAQSHHTVIFSSEHLHSRLVGQEDIARLKAFLDRHVDGFRVICYFREQSELRKSLYSTALRAGHSIALEDFGMPLAPGRHYYDYDLFFGKWADVFGPASLVPVIYDRAGFRDGDIRKDFITRIAPDIDLQRFSYAIASANEAFSNLHTVAARAINRAQPKFLGDQLNTLRLNLIRAALALDSLADGPIVDPQQAAIYDAFDASNRRFAARFLGRSDNPFPKPAPRRESPSPERRPGEVEDLLGETVEALLSLPGLVQLSPAEARTLTELAPRLLAEGAISKPQASTLLRLAQRALPDNPGVAKAMADVGERPD